MIKVLVVGDSHSICLRKANRDISYYVLTARGATAQGAVNPFSTTNALNRFKEYLDRPISRECEYVGVLLGEVDCGYLIWYRSYVHGIPVENQMNVSLENYEKFLKEVVCNYYPPEKTIVLSAPLPTILDNTDPNMLAGARGKVKNSIQERTRLTLTYNERLEEMCNRNGFIWADATTETLDESTGIIGDEWRNEDPYDHHLNPDKAWKIYDNAIRKGIEHVS